MQHECDVHEYAWLAVVPGNAAHIMHDKFLVVDSRFVFAGTANPHHLMQAMVPWRRHRLALPSAQSQRRRG